MRHTFAIAPLRRFCLLFPVLVFSLATAEDIKLNGKTIETPRYHITLSDSGLPEQIKILAVESELPLELRGKKKEVPARFLQSIGRGEQLRSPIRIEVAAGGKVTSAEPIAATQTALKKNTVICKSKLRAGEVNFELDLAYGSGGIITGTIAYSGKGDVESIGLAINFLGAIDFAFAGSPVAEKVQVYQAADYEVSTEEGLVWGNSEKDAKAQGRKSAPGPVTQMFVGSGDRGFTWLSRESKGWDIDAKASSATLSRNQAGQVTWRILFVNHQTRLKRKRSIEFSLRVHPSRVREANHRAVSWLEWPFSGTIAPALPSNVARQRKVELLRADANSHESLARYSILEGLAGGDALASGTHAETYPMNLFRYLAGTHTGLVSRLRSNARAFTRPSSDPAADRVLLGRALLCDIGLDADSLANLTGAATVLAALDKFGYFEADGKMEFIPFWRSHSAIRFGEIFTEDDAFALSETNPVGKVYISVYRRPQARTGTQTMIVLANESDKPVRDQLYVLDQARVFGGANALDFRTIKSSYDYSRFHRMSDWIKAGVAGKGSKGGQNKALQDLEDSGVVRQNVAKDGIEAYGPNVFIPAHDFRILFGRSK